MTEAVYYDRGFVRLLKENMDNSLFRLSWVYRSNWRVLHIDGFEGGLYLPRHCGQRIQFFGKLA